MYIIRIARYSNAIAECVSLGFENKVREVGKKFLKEKYLGTLISIGDAKDKDSKVLPDCRKVLGYYKVCYFTLGANKANNTF